MLNTSCNDLFLVDNKFQSYYYGAECCLKVFLYSELFLLCAVRGEGNN